MRLVTIYTFYSNICVIKNTVIKNREFQKKGDVELNFLLQEVQKVFIRLANAADCDQDKG